jgi:hypothetical protein
MLQQGTSLTLPEIALNLFLLLTISLTDLLTCKTSSCINKKSITAIRRTLSSRNSARASFELSFNPFKKVFSVTEVVSSSSSSSSSSPMLPQQYYTSLACCRVCVAQKKSTNTPHAHTTTSASFSFQNVPYPPLLPGFHLYRPPQHN